MIYLCVTVAVVGILWFAWFTAPLEMHRPTGRPMTRAEVEDLVVKLIVEKLDEWNINKRSDGEPFGYKPPTKGDA